MKNFILFICLSVLCVQCTKVEDGFQDKISYFPSESIDVYINGSSNGKIGIDLLNINNEKVDDVQAEVFKQPEVDTNSWFEIGYQYKKTFSYSPEKLKSGIYYFENSSPFVIKNPKKKNDVLVVYPSNTDNAYNENGGRSSYSKPKGNVLSYKRPFNIHSYAIEFLKWIPNQRFKVDYICDKDLDDYKNIESYKVIILPGHNEYWTRKARRNFDKFVDQGGNAIVLSGNTMWWQVRYLDGKMICFKKAELDSLVPDSLKSINWTSATLNYQTISSIGVDFNRGGYGLYEDSGWDGYKIINSSPLFEGTGINVGDTLTIPSAEYDGAPVVFENGFPILDTNEIDLYIHSILGFDKGFRAKETYGTFIIFQKNKNSGVIINTASTNWCSDGFRGKDGKKIKKLTYNFIDFLINDQPVF